MPRALLPRRFGMRACWPGARQYTRPLRLEQLECRSLLATVTLTAIADNTMYEESGDLSNGAGIHFFVGRTAGTNGALSRRGLVRFNLAGAIPAGSQIDSATLQLRDSRVPGGTPIQSSVGLHRALESWGEGASDAVCLGGNEGCGTQAAAGDATWTQRLYPATDWSTPGGQFVATASAQTTVGGIGLYQWTSPQLAADIQGWLTTPATNFGWVVKAADEATLRSAKRFDSRQNATAGNRPQLTIEYSASNQQPTLNAIPNPPAILEDAFQQSVTLSGISAGGADQQEITITAVSSNPNLIADPVVNYFSPQSTGTLFYTPEPNMSGTASITVTVKDNGGVSGGGVDTFTRTFTVTVTPVNDAPLIDPLASPVVVLEDSGLRSISLLGISSGPNETQTLTIAPTSNNPSLFSTLAVVYANPNATGTLNLVPAANQSGSALITITLTDNGGTLNGGVNITTRTFTVNVTSVNDAPTLAAIANPAAILEDAAEQTISLTGISAGPANESSQTVTLTPTSSNPAFFSNLTLDYTSPASTAALRYTPAPNQFGSAVITITARDNGGTAPGADTFARTFTVNVTGVNDAPTLNVIPDPPAMAKNAAAQTVNLSGISAGPNEPTQTLSFQAQSSNPGLIPNPTVAYTNGSVTGSLSYTPVTDQTGAAVITVTVTDSGGSTNGGVNVFFRTFTVNVTNINAAPTLDAIANPAAILEDAAAQSINLTGISAGGTETQALTVTATSSVPGLIPHPSVTYASPSQTGSLSYAPAANQFGTAVITVTVTDNGGIAGGGLDATARTFTVNVTPVNDAPTLDPIANPPAIQQNAGQQTVNLSGIAAGPGESQGLIVEATSGNPALIPNPTATYIQGATTGSVSFTPVADQSGTAIITVTVTDDGGTANGGVNFWMRTFTVTVFASTPANDPPSFIKGLDHTADDGSGVRTAPQWATSIFAGPPDESNQTLDFQVANNNNGLFLVQPAVSAAGTLSFTPMPNRSGVAQVSVVLHDSGGVDTGGVDVSAPQVFLITVNKPHPWHNTIQLPAPRVGSLDVDLSGTIGPNDAIQVINYLNASLPATIPASAPIGGPGGVVTPRLAKFLDTGGASGNENLPNNVVAPIDAVLVINWLNAFPPETASVGAGEAAALASGDRSLPVIAGNASESRGSAVANAADLTDLITLLAYDAAMLSATRRRRLL